MDVLFGCVRAVEVLVLKIKQSWLRSYGVSSGYSSLREPLLLCVLRAKCLRNLLGGLFCCVF